MATASSMSSSGIHLPQRLVSFFARYPPKVYSAKYTGATIPLSRPTKATLKTPESHTVSSDPASDPTTAMTQSTSTPPTESPPPASTQPIEQTLPNPFLPWRNPESGRWRPPVYSLRRQADLVKLAKRHGVEPLLPAGRKSSAFKEARLLELGLRVRGTGEGQRVKGHKWERRMPAKLEERRKAMERMPEMIRLWKQLGHGRGWKKYPK